MGGEPCLQGMGEREVVKEKLGKDVGVGCEEGEETIPSVVAGRVGV